MRRVNPLSSFPWSFLSCAAPCGDTPHGRYSVHCNPFPFPCCVNTRRRRRQRRRQCVVHLSAGSSDNLNYNATKSNDQTTTTTTSLEREKESERRTDPPFTIVYSGNKQLFNSICHSTVAVVVIGEGAEEQRRALVRRGENSSSCALRD